MDFQINYCEAQILEMSLRGVEDKEIVNHHDLILEIGTCLIGEGNGLLEITESDLWFLRDRIQPHCKAEEHTGMDLIKRIYECLLEMTNESYVPLRTLRSIWEGSDVEGSTDQDNAESCAEPNS
ncbi:hypothetical protein LCGC14_0560940 [marine sediment metagenome]|uniref:Uncharacterized protein n=1 Tax=marine sediment metagenome TaxID=412755 RepID=A0A0F9UV77_9ZZZZ